MGRTDGAPTAAGIVACVAQARTIGAERLIASDLRRCRLAGDAIGAVLARPLAVHPRWRENDFGAWDGSAAAAIAREAMDSCWGDPDANPTPRCARRTSLVSTVTTIPSHKNPVHPPVP